MSVENEESDMETSENAYDERTSGCACFNEFIQGISPSPNNKLADTFYLSTLSRVFWKQKGGKNMRHIKSNPSSRTLFIDFSPEWGGTTRLGYTDVLVVREIDFRNWLAREYMPAYQHCGLFYPLVWGLA